MTNITLQRRSTLCTKIIHKNTTSYFNIPANKMNNTDNSTPAQRRHVPEWENNSPLQCNKLSYNNRKLESAVSGNEQTVFLTVKMSDSCCTQNNFWSLLYDSSPKNSKPTRKQRQNSPCIAAQIVWAHTKSLDETLKTLREKLATVSLHPAYISTSITILHFTQHKNAHSRYTTREGWHILN